MNPEPSIDNKLHTSVTAVTAETAGVRYIFVVGSASKVLSGLTRQLL